MKKQLIRIRRRAKVFLLKFVIYGGLCSLCIDHFGPYFDPLISLYLELAR